MSNKTKDVVKKYGGLFSIEVLKKIVDGLVLEHLRGLGINV